MPIPRWRPTLPVLLVAFLAPLRGQEVKRTYAVRIDGRVVGYQIETEKPITEDGRAVVHFDTRGLMKIEILGAKVDQKIDQTWILDPQTRAALRVKARLTAGEMKIAADGKLGDAGFELADGKTLDPATVVISPEFGWLAQRGPTRAGEAVTLDYFMPEMGSVAKATITLDSRPEREVDVLGTQTAARVYHVELAALGVSFQVFVSRATYETIRYEMPAQKLTMDRVAEEVVERIERVDMTSGILVKTNLDLEDPSGLTFMRVRARIDSTTNVTAESLTVAGQTFTGTVRDGRIDGVFEIRPRRHDGTGALPFPVPESSIPTALHSFLRPEESIESDDAAIVAKARELATGATSSFDVVERLARWTHANITYTIPGGVTAKRTMEIRSGECGGHSRVLAAMLRSLGMPARTPMGGMYVPLYGGSFGQHMWTEVWLGDAIDWLAVDCTAGQSMFIDAGHIRVAEGLSLFRPESVEVLDHAPKVVAPAAAPRRRDAWPYTPNETLTYVWSIAGKPLGEEQLTYQTSADGGHVFKSSLDLNKGKLVETTKTVVGDDGRLVSFHAVRKTGKLQTTFDVKVDGTQAIVDQKSSEGDRSESIDVEPSIFPLHNNCMAHFAIVACRAGPWTEGAEAKVRLLHHEQRSVFAMTLRAKGSEEVAAGGKIWQATALEVSLVGVAITMHVDAQGRVLRWHQKQGDVTIELKPQ